MARRSQRKSRKFSGASADRPETPASGPGLADWRSLDPRLRAAGLFGLLAGMIVVGFFIFPVKVDPIEALSLWLAMMSFGVVLALSAYGRADFAFMNRAGGAAALAVFSLAAWAVIRWRFADFPAGIGVTETVPIRSAGRDAVMAYQFFAFAFVLGLGLGSLDTPRAVAVWRAFRGVLVVAAFGFAILGLYQFFFGYGAMLDRLRESQAGQTEMDPLLRQSLEHALTERRIGGTLGNGNVFAAWLSVLAVACLSLLAKGYRPALRLMGIAGYLVVSGTLLLTGSRGGILTLLVATAGAGLLLWSIAGRGVSGEKGSGIRKAASAISAPLLMTSLFVLTARSVWAIDIAYRLTRMTTIRERINYWTIAFNIWTSKPIVGGGPGAFELFYPQLKAATARESRFAHSWIFQTLAELGLVGLLCLAVFGVALVLAVWKSWRSLSQANPDGEFSRDARKAGVEALWLALISIVLAFNGLFEYSLHTPEFLALLGLCSGGLVGLAPTGPLASHPRAAASLKLRAGLAGLLAIFCLAASSWLVPRSQLAANWEWKAKGAALAGDPFLAAGFYGRASRLLPDDEGLLVRWSGALSQLADRHEEAGELLRRAEALNPLSASIRAARGRFDHRAGHPEQALRKFGEAIELYPTDAGYRIERARLLHELGRDNEALADIETIENEGLPVWAYLRPGLDTLREDLGLPATAETLRERERAARRERRNGEGDPSGQGS